MPVYGKEKNKEMGRSILPTTARKQAKRRKDKLHRRNRRVVNHDLHAFRGYASEVIEDYEDDTSDLEYYAEPHRSDDDWDDIVYYRREHDKLAHFEKWAYERTKHMRAQDRWSKIKTMINGDLIGMHAMSHLEFLKYDPLERNTWHDNLPRQLRQRSYINKYYAEQNRLRHLVETAVHSIAQDNNKRRKFNEYLRKNAMTDIQTVLRWNYDVYDPRWGTYKRYLRYEEKVEWNGVRTLNGYHDVTKFIRDIFATQREDPKLGYHPSWLNLTKKYFNIS